MSDIKILIYIYIGFFALLIVILLIRMVSRIRVRKKVRTLAESSIGVTPKEIINLREATLQRNKYRKKVVDDFVGVYIIYNESKDMYYVGQAKKVLQRVTQHFTGHGNGDVYADYKYGDKFTVKTIAFNKSGYDSIDRLEKDTIETYSAFSKGYNKTRGNRY